MAHPVRNNLNYYISIVSLKKMGKQKQAQKMLTHWEKEKSNDSFRQWATAYFNNNTSVAQKLETSVLPDSSEEPISYYNLLFDILD